MSYFSDKDYRVDTGLSTEDILKIGRSFQMEDTWRGSKFDTAKLLCDEIERLKEKLEKIERVSKRMYGAGSIGIYRKYVISHADGTPLKGKSYFVLRLDSDDPMEKARVDSAMKAYLGDNEIEWKDEENGSKD